MRVSSLLIVLVGVAHSLPAAPVARHVAPPSLLLNAADGVCSVPSDQQIECGFRGIQRWECLLANCCWRDDRPNTSARPDGLVLSQGRADASSSPCYHRVLIADLNDRERATEVIEQSEAHVWRVYNSNGANPARFIVDFPAGSDVDMLVKCCDSSGGASPTCPDFDNYDFWSRGLARRSPFRYDVYDEEASACGEWGIMIHGIGSGNNSYSIYSEIDRNLTVNDMNNEVVYRGEMGRDDWRFYRFHVRRAYNVHIPIRINKFDNVVSRTLTGPRKYGNTNHEWQVQVPFDTRGYHGFGRAELTFSYHACPIRNSRVSSGALSFNGVRVAGYTRTDTSGCDTRTITTDISAAMNGLAADADPDTGFLTLNARSSLSGRSSTNYYGEWKLSLRLNPRVASYARWDHLPHWMNDSHDLATRTFIKGDLMCVRLDFDIPKTGILYLGMNSTRENVDYSIQAIQNNRGPCEITL